MDRAAQIVAERGRIHSGRHGQGAALSYRMVEFDGQEASTASNVRAGGNCSDKEGSHLSVPAQRTAARSGDLTPWIGSARGLEKGARSRKGVQKRGHPEKGSHLHFAGWAVQRRLDLAASQF